MIAKLARLFLITAILAGTLASLAISAHPVYAQEEITSVIYCKGADPNPCEILSEAALVDLESISKFWMYQSYGMYDFRIQGVWYTRAVDPIPDEIHIDRDSFTSIPQLGIYWWKDRLVYHESGWTYDDDIPLTNPNKAEELSVYELSEERRLVTYQWDGAKTLTWNFDVELTDTEIVIKVNQFMVQFMYPVDTLPYFTQETYDLPANVDWVSGEELRVVAVHKNSRTIPSTWEEKWLWEDVSWLYEDDLNELIANGTDETEAMEIINTKFQKDANKYRGVFPNYKNTLWSVTQEWIDGYTFERQDGSLVRISEDNLMTSRACTEEEHCYSTSYNLSVGDLVYVYPYTLEDIWNSLDYENGAYANLWVFNVSPARDVTLADKTLLVHRMQAGEVTRIDGVISEPEDIDGDGELDITYEDGTMILPLHTGYMPPVGTSFHGYIYTESAVIPHDNAPEGRVMALFDEDNMLWYFNNSGEKGHSFDAETYGISCGGMMSINLWFEGCTP